MATQSFIQVAPDSTGKKVRNFTDGTIFTQAVAIVDQDGNPIAPTTARTAASNVATTSGSVAAGAQSVQFIPSANFTGTLLGQPWPGTNAPVGFSAEENDTLGAIAYTITTGSLTILTIT